LKKYQLAEGKALGNIIADFLDALITNGTIDTKKALELSTVVCENQNNQAIFNMGLEAGLYALETGTIKPLETAEPPEV